MRASDETRRAWRTNWLRSIREFADNVTQNRLWLAPDNVNPHFSFVECMSCYFDDLGLSDSGYQGALEQGLVAKEEVAALAEFHAKADAYKATDDYDPEAILADTKWQEIVAAAQLARAALLKVIADPQERALLTEP